MQQVKTMVYLMVSAFGLAGLAVPAFAHEGMKGATCEKCADKKECKKCHEASGCKDCKSGKCEKCKTGECKDCKEHGHHGDGAHAGHAGHKHEHEGAAVDQKATDAGHVESGHGASKTEAVEQKH